jgi:aspartokinase/homoserine dehydrogenase 1
LYPQFFESGIHVITPNKKGNTKSIEFYKKIKKSSTNHRVHYLYETTVGAGLPIINTLRELIRTGDRIISIEGVFSGTLSYIFNTFSESIPFSKVVLDAKAKGYTEPDPRDDLSGIDVARKLVILAREMGLVIELSDVHIDPLLDTSLLTVNTDDFLKQLSSMDKKLLQLLTQSNTQHQVLRFVGQINDKGQASVGLKKYSKNHAFANLSKTDNIVAFQTERYFEQPLVVQGPGAGREVTAGGVFADLLRLCSYLGARL